MRRLVTLAVLLTTIPAAAQQVDLILRNGRILDGTGGPEYRADLAIDHGRIVQIGRSTSPARETIDVQNAIISPGFIDMLGQDERSILADPHLPGKIFQGITSEITGEGTTIAPANLRAYLARLEHQGIAINFATYTGATTIRKLVIGEANRLATPAELLQMQSLVAEAMRAGAVGLSSSLMYAPAPYASTEELTTLAQTAYSFGGIYATHLRTEGDHIDTSLDEAFTIARNAHIPLEIFHLKAAGVANWGSMPDLVARIESARASGLDIAADTYAYTSSGNSLSAFIPPWAHDGGTAALLTRLADPTQRALIRASIEHDRTWDNEWLMLQTPADVTLASTSAAALKSLQGKDIATIAQARTQDPIDCILDLVAADPLAKVILKTMSQPDVAYALKQPWVSIGLDAPASPPGSTLRNHPRAFATFPRILRKYVREDHLLTLPEAIRKFTSLPASRLHLTDRGTLKVGMWADIAVFDPDKIRDLATYDNPNQLAEGMQFVFVNGIAVIRDGKMTQALPGKVLPRPRLCHRIYCAFNSSTSIEYPGTIRSNSFATPLTVLSTGTMRFGSPIVFVSIVVAAVRLISFALGATLFTPSSRSFNRCAIEVAFTSFR